MQFKIDENLHSDAADLLRRHGHDALTVHEQGLRGGADSDIADVCRREERAILAAGGRRGRQPRPPQPARVSPFQLS